MLNAANSNLLSLFGKEPEAESHYMAITTSPITGEIVARMWTTMPDGTRRFFMAERDLIKKKIKNSYGAQRSEWELALAALNHTIAMRSDVVGVAG